MKTRAWFAKTIAIARSLAARFTKWFRQTSGRIKSMLGVKEKGIAALETGRIEERTSNFDFRALPGYVAFRAAALREKLLLQHILIGVSALFVLYFGISRTEVASLQSKIREKEYILAPGVQDFISVAPQRVPDSYVHAAAIDFIGQLGNVNPQNIDEQYGALTNSMAADFRVRFQAEARDWIERVRKENLSEIIAVTRREITTEGHGRYHVRAFARCDTYAGSDYLGFRNEVIEMDLALTPPRSDKRWFLEITKLVRQSERSWQAKESMGSMGKPEVAKQL